MQNCEKRATLKWLMDLSKNIGDADSIYGNIAECFLLPINTALTHLLKTHFEKQLKLLF